MSETWFACPPIAAADPAMPSASGLVPGLLRRAPATAEALVALNSQTGNFSYSGLPAVDRIGVEELEVAMT